MADDSTNRAQGCLMPSLMRVITPCFFPPACRPADTYHPPVNPAGSSSSGSCAIQQASSQKKGKQKKKKRGEQEPKGIGKCIETRTGPPSPKCCPVALVTQPSRPPPLPPRRLVPSRETLLAGRVPTLLCGPLYTFVQFSVYNCVDCVFIRKRAQAARLVHIDFSGNAL